MSKRKAILIIVLAIAASVLIMESGVLSVTFGGIGGSSLSVSYEDTDLESLQGFSFTKTKSGYTLFMEKEGGEPQTVDIVLDVQSISIEGSYWMPLQKRLKCRCVGIAVSTDNLIDVSFDVHLDHMSIEGLCSPGAAKRLARQRAMEETRRIIEIEFDTVAQSIRGKSKTGWTAASS